MLDTARYVSPVHTKVLIKRQIEGSDWGIHDLRYPHIMPIATLLADIMCIISAPNSGSCI